MGKLSVFARKAGSVVLFVLYVLVILLIVALVMRGGRVLAQAELTKARCGDAQHDLCVVVVERTPDMPTEPNVIERSTEEVVTTAWPTDEVVVWQVITPEPTPTTEPTARPNMGAAVAAAVVGEIPVDPHLESRLAEVYRAYMTSGNEAATSVANFHMMQTNGTEVLCIVTRITPATESTPAEYLMEQQWIAYGELNLVAASGVNAVQSAPVAVP